ncbi:MAG: S-layer homology domain-containing protein [Defluviitaleaceae bacterium]|nr:S-layer homology domain-containing protein [Defluviitaleaceae bacterium]MCL2836013.1 S-layer homology domain-containing protein [Defluviitaleaceae bacterium]
MEYTYEAETPLPEDIGVDMHVTRALAAKQLAFIHSGRIAINSMEREITFTDVEMEHWHNRYVNAVFAMGLMSGAGDVFMPDAPLTYSQARFLLNRVYADDDEFEHYFDHTEPIPYSYWTELLLDALDKASGGDIWGLYGISRISLIPLQTVENGVFTDCGPFGCAGIDIAPYIDKQITALVKDDEILALLGVESEAPVIRGAYIQDIYDEAIVIFAGGAIRAYAWLNPLPAGNVCDITVSRGTALDVKILETEISGTLNRITPGFTELRDIELLPNAADVRVYDVSEKNVAGGTPALPVPVLRGLGDVISGSDDASFIVEDGEVRAVLINHISDPRTVRVLLSTTGFRGYLHESVSLTSDVPFTVWANGDPYAYAAGEVFTAAVWENLHIFSESKPRIYITTDTYYGRIELLSILRNGEHPRYRGVLEICLEADGRFTVVNELNIEEYLYSVVSSDSLHTHGFEAAKVQAVTARSYAYTHFFANSFGALGANFNDSVISQLYNNMPENTLSVRAVNETRGMMLSHAGNVIAGNFFSASAGVTANSGEVWPDMLTGAFPGETLPYLRSTVLHSGGNYGDLRNESNAAAFFRDWNVQCCDSGSPWFRWYAEMTAAELTASINAALPTLYAANPALIKTLQPDGSFRSRPIETIGDLVNIEALSRGEGGNVMSMQITGTEAVITVYTELNVRHLLRPASVTRHMGGAAENLTMMPSAFFAIEKHVDEYGGMWAVTFHGGGFGHGAGMSQSGVRGMAEAGFNFEQILRRYYRSAVIVKRW